jgi:hypothetical protein
MPYCLNHHQPNGGHTDNKQAFHQAACVHNGHCPVNPHALLLEIQLRHGDIHDKKRQLEMLCAYLKQQCAIYGRYMLQHDPNYTKHHNEINTLFQAACVNNGYHPIIPQLPEFEAIKGIIALEQRKIAAVFYCIYNASPLLTAWYRALKIETTQRQADRLLQAVRSRLHKPEDHINSLKERADHIRSQKEHGDHTRSLKELEDFYRHLFNTTNLPITMVTRLNNTIQDIKSCLKIWILINLACLLQTEIETEKNKHQGTVATIESYKQTLNNIEGLFAIYQETPNSNNEQNMALTRLIATIHTELFPVQPQPPVRTRPNDVATPRSLPAIQKDSSLIDDNNPFEFRFESDLALKALPPLHSQPCNAGPPESLEIDANQLVDSFFC